MGDFLNIRHYLENIIDRVEDLKAGLDEENLIKIKCSDIWDGIAGNIYLDKDMRMIYLTSETTFKRLYKETEFSNINESSWLVFKIEDTELFAIDIDYSIVLEDIYQRFTEEEL